MAKRKFKILPEKLTKSETISIVLSIAALIISVYSTIKSIQLTELTAGLRVYPELKGTLRVFKGFDKNQEILPNASKIYLLSLFNNSTVDASSIEVDFIDHKLGEYADSAHRSKNLTDTSFYPKPAFFVNRLEPYKSNDIYFRYFNYDFLIHEIRISYFRQIDSKKFNSRLFLLYVPGKGFYKEKFLRELLVNKTLRTKIYNLRGNTLPLDSVEMFVHLLDSVKKAPLNDLNIDVWDF